jgi:hypothetical protein
MFSDKKVGILTKDTDFFRLLGATPSILGAKEFRPYNGTFRKPIHKNPVRLYYRIGDECDELSTDSIKYPNNLALYNVGPKRSSEIREQISQFWIHFADYNHEVGISFKG